MKSRREFLRQVGSVAALGVGAPNLFSLDAGRPLVSAGDVSFLRELARATIRSATKSESSEAAGFAFVTPGGHYPALWIRDFSMACRCGLLSGDTMRRHLRLIAQCQNDETERKLKSGAVIPPFAIPDHIDFDARPVFYPGTYSSGEDQGGEPWGVLPPVDDHYEFVHIAHSLWKMTRDKSFLSEEIRSISLFERLVLAVECPETDATTGLVSTTCSRRAVGFGFCDAVTLTGSLLFPSLLRHRALGELVELAGSGDTRRAAWRRQRAQIEKHLVPTFLDGGWLLAATGVGRQPDVWGTALALSSNLVPHKFKSQVLHTVRDSYQQGTLTYRGAVRHVPTDHDFSRSTAWEKTAGVSLNHYQNGAYWHVPSGWLARALAQTDRTSAVQLVREMVDHFRQEDLRLGQGAPWECLHPDGNYRQNPVYTASVTLPLETLTMVLR